MKRKSKNISRAVGITEVNLPDFTDEQLEPLIEALAEILAEEYLKKMEGVDNVED